LIEVDYLDYGVHDESALGDPERERFLCRKPA